MAKRFCGKLVVTLKYVGGETGREYTGSVCLGRMFRFPLDGLRAPPHPFPHAYDAPEAYDKMARAAISFATCPTGEESVKLRGVMAALSCAMDHDADGPFITRKR